MRSLHATIEASEQYRGRIQRHLLLTHWGAATLSGQAFNRSNPLYTSTQWASLSLLFDGKLGY
jgi:hypothetical protein